MISGNKFILITTLSAALVGGAILGYGLKSLFLSGKTEDIKNLRNEQFVSLAVPRQLLENKLISDWSAVVEGKVIENDGKFLTIQEDSSDAKTKIFMSARTEIQMETQKADGSIDSKNIEDRKEIRNGAYVSVGVSFPEGQAEAQYINGFIADL